MQFDFTKLPDKAQLSLCEMVTFLAWGVALKPDELGRSGSPSERASQCEWDAQLAECQRQAEADPELSDLVRLLSDWRGIPLMPTADTLEEICRTKVVATMIANSELDDDHVEPLPEQLETYRQTWPPACQVLYRRAVDRQVHWKAEWGELKEAQKRWYQAASDGVITVTGRPRGVPNASRHVVDHADFTIEQAEEETDGGTANGAAISTNRPHVARCSYHLDLQTNSLERRPRHRKGLPDPRPAYDDVCCERENFARWTKTLSDRSMVPEAELQSVDGSGRKHGANDDAIPEDERPRFRKGERFAKDLLIFNDVMTSLTCDPHLNVERCIIASAQAYKAIRDVPAEDFTEDETKLVERIDKRRKRAQRKAKTQRN